ncbi:MAG: glycosyltransferase [Bdellovibrionales bacterium]|nr:glycosyltransferase [Bdellovibrionales bacterium]
MIQNSSNNPEVSVIVPTYNRLQTLPRAIHSILDQSYKNFDLWIVDDGSNDGTREWVQTELLSNSDQPIECHYLRTNRKGVSHARNKAIQLSRAPWIALLDSDDEWLPTKLEKQLSFARQYPDIPLIHGEEIWVRNGVRVNPMKKHKKSGGRIFEMCVPICCISPSTSLIQRRIFDEVGLFREDFPVCEDYDLWLKITSRYPIGFIEDPLITKYGGHEDQLSRAFKAIDYYRVRALGDILNSQHLSLQERLLVKETIQKKCEILLKGYERHENMNHYQEVQQIQNFAQQFTV